MVTTSTTTPVAATSNALKTALAGLDKADAKAKPTGAAGEKVAKAKKVGHRAGKAKIIDPRKAQMEAVGNGAIAIVKKHKAAAAKAKAAEDNKKAKKTAAKAKKAAKPAKTTKKTTAKKAPSSPGSIALEAKITLLVKENPKREGTNGYKTFNKYKTGMTVEDFLKKGGTRADLAWDLAHDFIKVK